MLRSMRPAHRARAALAPLAMVALVTTLTTVLATALAATPTPAVAPAPAVIAPAERPAAMAARPEAAVLLGIARAGTRLVAVGERGLVLLSDDQGRAWRQAASPTSVTLTSVHFASPTRGWASGHAGVILATEDGGTLWHRQLDGRAAAAATLQQARAALGGVAGADKVEAEKAVAEARRLVDDGPDKPFFDLWFADERRGFAVGAYNLFMRTDDGGNTWAAATTRLPNPKGKHLYAIGGSGKTVFIAGEQGLLLRSTDGGHRFEALPSPYAGSFFTLALLPQGELVAAGLRGHAFRSTDQGDTWQPIKGLPPLTWVASSVAADGSVWLGNQAGETFVSRDAGLSWAPAPPPPGRPGAPLTSLLAMDGDSALTTTWRGFGRAARPADANR